jgi:hypothetical protein
MMVLFPTGVGRFLVHYIVHTDCGAQLAYSSLGTETLYVCVRKAFFILCPNVVTSLLTVLRQ